MRTLLITLLLLTGAPSGIAAQLPGRGTGRDRAQLERRIRQRLGEVVKLRLGLSDAQMDRLQGVTLRYEDRRADLFRRETALRREVRQTLRNDDSSSAAQDRVATGLDEAFRVQRQRLDLLEAEQRDLAQFLTPIQRAKYFGMQEQLRRRVDEMRNRADEAGVDSVERPGAALLFRRRVRRVP